MDWGADGVEAALGGLIGSIGSPGFAQAGLTAVNRCLQAASWSVYRLRPGQEPILHLSASHGVADRTQSCFAAYRSGLCQRDRSFDLLRRGRRCEPRVLRMRAEEAPNDDHREAIYRAHALLDRLSVAVRDEDDSLLAVNLYHHEHQGPFGEAELARFSALAPLLLRTVQRQLALHGRPLSPRLRLQAECPSLSERELDVCERLLKGWTYEAIAEDLGLSLASVKTYRARAFQRLGLNFRNQLFARLA